MSEKHDLVGYLNGLMSLMAAQDTSGGTMRSQTLGREFNRGYARLKEILVEEEKAAEEGEQHASR